MILKTLLSGFTLIFTIFAYANIDQQSIKIKISGKVSQNLEINSENDDRIVCASSGKYGFYIWGLRKVDNYKTTFMADLRDKTPPTGIIDYSDNKNTFLTVVTRPEEYFWTPSSAPCHFSFKNDGVNLSGTFRCKSLYESSTKLENTTENKVNISGSFSCKIQDWNH